LRARTSQGVTIPLIIDEISPLEKSQGQNFLVVSI
jgi:hypothetical protein